MKFACIFNPCLKIAALALPIFISSGAMASFDSDFCTALMTTTSAMNYASVNLVARCTDINNPASEACLASVVSVRGDSPAIIFDLTRSPGAGLSGITYFNEGKQSFTIDHGNVFAKSNDAKGFLAPPSRSDYYGGEKTALSIDLNRHWPF